MDRNHNVPVYTRDWSTTATRDYRSPELFHEMIVLGQLRTTSGVVLLDELRRESIETGRRLVALVGRSNVLFVKNEDMQQLSQNVPVSHSPTSSRFLETLSQFTGLALHLFPNLTTGTNCNNAKGLAVECEATTAAGSETSNHASNSSSNGTNNNHNQSHDSRVYEISENRPLRPETRALIYESFAPECDIWRREFQMDYEACVSRRGIVGG